MLEPRLVGRALLALNGRFQSAQLEGGRLDPFDYAAEDEFIAALLRGRAQLEAAGVRYTRLSMPLPQTARGSGAES